MAHVGSKIFHIEYRTEREVGRKIHMIGIGTEPFEDGKWTSRTVMKLLNNTARVPLRPDTDHNKVPNLKFNKSTMRISCSLIRLGTKGEFAPDFIMKLLNMARKIQSGFTRLSGMRQWSKIQMNSGFGASNNFKRAETSAPISRIVISKFCMRKKEIP